MKQKKTFEQEASEIAKPYLANPDNKVVYVNECGMVWLNNAEDQMSAMFAKKQQKYVAFHNVGAEEKPLEEKPTKSKKK